MKNRIFLLLLFMGICSPVTVKSQSYKVIKSSEGYKNIDGTELSMDIYQPQVPEGMQLPAIVFFFGGGWVGGTPDHFRLQSEYFASQGMVAVCPDYRTKNKHGTSPFESVKDARSAMRFLKKNGHRFGLDTLRIVASGGSAGGHLAACTALIMHGKDDKTVPYENVVRFSHAMKQQENRCILKGYKKQEHGFFNYSKNPRFFKKTLFQTETFLDAINLLKGKSWVNQYVQTITE